MTLLVLSVLLRHEGGGAEAAVRRLVGPFRSRDVDLVPVALDPPRPGEAPPGGPVLSRGRSVSPLGIATTAWRLRRLVVRRRPAIVHLHCERPELVGVLALLGTRRPRLVVTEHSSVQWAAHPWLGRAVRRRLHRWGATFVRCYGERGAVIPNPTDPAAPLLGPSESLRRLVLVSRLIGSKRVDACLRAAAGAGWSGPVMIFGAGPERERLATLAAKLGVAADFRGYVADPWAAVQPGDLFLSASTYEGEPLTVVEALTRGLPLLLSDIPAHRALVGSQARTLFSSEAELTRALRRACREGTATLVPPAEVRDSVVGRRRPEVVAAAWESLYRELTGAGVRS